MTFRTGWAGGLLVAATVGLGDAAAAPADCLAYRDNPHIAACANQYSPGGAPGAPAADVAATRSPPLRATADAELKSVPVIVAASTAPAAPAPEAPVFTVDRQVLTNTVAVGALAGTLLVLVALGFWRWGATLLKDCPWCASKISRSAQTCPRCFRAL